MLHDDIDAMHFSDVGARDTYLAHVLESVPYIFSMMCFGAVKHSKWLI